jgi:rSAM/selenodomain-associated transferase 1
MMNLRSRWSGIATGDQGIFIARTLFADIGGFPVIPLMEDIALSRLAKARDAPLCLRERIVTSARRWERHGALRTIALMWQLRLAYSLGGDPARLACRYHAARANETRVIVFARAPEPGTAKTRLIPLLGADGAAALQGLMMERALTTALAAAVGRVELWCAPSAQHPLLAACIERHDINGATQREGDLGARMQHAVASTLAIAARVLVIGTDSPALTASDLRAAAAALEAHDAVIVPAEDGGYVLLGLKRWDERLFKDITWGSEQVFAETRARLVALNWRWHELPKSWDVDRPQDFARLRASGLLPEIEVALATHS